MPSSRSATPTSSWFLALATWCWMAAVTFMATTLSGVGGGKRLLDVYPDFTSEIEDVL